MSDPASPRGFFEVGELTADQRHQRDLASYGYEQDLYKHVATLSTGSVVLLTTFLEKLITNPHWRPLVGVSLGAFALSLVGMVSMQMLSVLHVSRHPDEQPTRWGRLGRYLVLSFGFGGFLVGIAALTLFGIRNLW